ncbi:MAG TPA: cyclomaltodextrin glucanotransferase, partial [Lysobacter sp.]
GFMRGKPEHDGNRNYFGAERIASAASHPIHRNLSRIAHVRAASPALQRGLQVNVELKGDRAAFYRVYQHEGVSQIALVLLNKGDAPAAFDVKQYVQSGTWRAAIAGNDTKVRAGGSLKAAVPAHGVEVFLLDAPVTQPQLRAELDRLMKVKRPE